MKVNKKILAFMFILNYVLSHYRDAVQKDITADSNETQETQAQIDDAAYGKGLSFTYNDYADNVLSFKL